VPCTASTLLVISADAKGIAMRPEGLPPATAKAAACQMQSAVTLCDQVTWILAELRQTVHR
jgi:hypothetical protein